MKKIKSDNEEEQAVLYTLVGVDIPIDETVNLSMKDIDSITEELSSEGILDLLSRLLLREHELNDRK